MLIFSSNYIAVIILPSDLELDPNNALIHISLGAIYSKSKKFDLAIQEYKAAIELNPNNAGFHSNLANIYYMQRKFDLGFKEGKISLKLDSDINIFEKCFYSFKNYFLYYKQLSVYTLSDFLYKIYENLTEEIIPLDKVDALNPTGLDANN